MTVGYYLLPLDGSAWIFGALLGLAMPVALVPFALHQVRRILSSSQPVATTVRALAALPTVVVLSFASAYYGIEAHNPGEVVGLETKTDALYFATTVLSTVGFGDIHAAGQVARCVAILHMVVNVVMFGFILQAVTWAARRATSAADQRDDGFGPGSTTLRG